MTLLDNIPALCNLKAMKMIWLFCNEIVGGT